MGVAEDFKQAQRRTWAAGDWPTMAETIQEVSDLAIERLGIGPGVDALDVGCGNGNVVVPAAVRGARVTGLDLVPRLLELARARAAAAGVEVELVEGDAEDLPFEDDSFDRVSSIFGAIFAPRHRRAAAELARVTRPGGRIAVAAWTPDGLNGQMFKTMAAHMPPPPPELEPPILWGSEDHVRDLFAGTGAELAFERHAVPVAWGSPEAWVSHLEEALGPVVMAKAALAPQGAWDAARADLVALYERLNEARDGTLLTHAEYLLALIDV